MTESPLSARSRVALALATLLLLAVSMFALTPVFTGAEWWLPTVFTALIVIATGVALRAVRSPVVFVPVGQMLVLLAWLTLVFAAPTSWLLVIPTGRSFELFRGLLDSAAQSIAQQSAPAMVVPALEFALMLGGGILALLADAVVQIARVPALTAALAVVPIVIPGFITGSGNVAVVLVMTAGAFLLVLRVDVRARQRGGEARRPDDVPDTSDEAGATEPLVVAPRRLPFVSTFGRTVALGVVGVVVASLLAAVTPSLSTSLFNAQGAGGSVFGRGVSPFVDLGRDLRRPEPRLAFHYTSVDGDRPYFTLLMIEDFSGEVWSATDRELDVDNRVSEFPRPPGLAADLPTTERSIDIVIDELRSPWLPLPTPTLEVSGLRGSWFWNDETRTVRGLDTDTGGQRFSVTRLVPEVTREQLAAAGSTVPAQLQRYLELPDELPESIVETSAEVTGDAATPYDAAVSIQAFLRSARFTYTTDAPAYSEDGGGFEVIDAFLDDGGGYCVHFASTMAVFAREAGIPARIAIGYAQGQARDDRVDGTTRVDVDSHDLHAWPELYFENLGWVPFEPTPSRGTVPEYTRPAADESPVAPFTDALPAEPDRDQPVLDPERDLSSVGGGAEAEPLDVGAMIFAMLAGLVALSLLPAVVRAAGGWVRRRRAKRGDADAAWIEFSAVARDLGWAMPPGETPRAALGRLESTSAEPLRDAIERARYADPDAVLVDGEVLESALVAAVHDLRARAEMGERVRARMLPASLVPGTSAQRRLSSARNA